MGTPQGAVASPQLANVYLHYVFDLWVQWWRAKFATGDIVVVRYADDFVVGFQHRDEAERFRKELAERLTKFGLALHPEKTRLIAFGRFAADPGRSSRRSKPETFDFLGFTHICGRMRRSGRFLVQRKSAKKRLRAKLSAIRVKLLRQRHRPLPVQGAWLRQVVQGWLNYHAVPGNMPSLETFYAEIRQSWLYALRRRSQRHRMPWERYKVISDRWIPRPKILHAYPSVRFEARHPR